MPHPLSSRRGGAHKQHQYHQNFHRSYQNQHYNYDQIPNLRPSSHMNNVAGSRRSNGNGVIGPIQAYAPSSGVYGFDYQRQQKSPQRCYENNHYVQNVSSAPMPHHRQLSSHEPDEEAAANALLMSAGASEEAAANALLMSAGASKRRKSEPKKAMDEDSRNEVEGRKLEDSTDLKTSINGVHVSPSSNDNSKSHSHRDEVDAESGDHDSIQDEMNGASIEDFPMKLHNLLSSGVHSSVIQWMPDGRFWRIVNWHELSKIMPRYFPKFCASRSGNISVMNRVDLFLKEVEVWGFQKKKDSAGNACLFCHEFFIKVAPNLIKYLKPFNSIRSLQAVEDQILSPPRIGRLNPRIVNSRPLDAIFCGKREKRERPVVEDDESVVAEEFLSKVVTSPVTPSFTLTNHLSPNNIISPRCGVQSNRGKGKASIMFAVSKRGRRSANVSSRGGHRGGVKLDIPL